MLISEEKLQEFVKIFNSIAPKSRVVDSYIIRNHTTKIIQKCGSEFSIWNEDVVKWLDTPSEDRKHISTLFIINNKINFNYSAGDPYW